MIVTSSNKVRAQHLQRSEIPLTMSLGTLILLHIVHQYLEAAIDAAVVQV